MRGPKPTLVELSQQQQSVLEQIVRRQTSPQYQVRRAKIILCMGEGKNNQQTAQTLEVHRETVQQWRSRWLNAVPRLTAAEVAGVSAQELLSLIEEVLMDERRAGAKSQVYGGASYPNHCPSLRSSPGIKTTHQSVECLGISNFCRSPLVP